MKRPVRNLAIALAATLILLAWHTASDDPVSETPAAVGGGSVGGGSVGPGSALGSNWPQWRGPGGMGVSDETGLPIEWSTTRNVVFKTAIGGRGHSSPVVWEDRIFLTTASEGEVVEGAGAPVHYIQGEVF